MNTLVIALLASVVGPSILALLLGHQRSKEKRQDYKRQDDVANEAKRQQDEVAEQAKVAAKLLSDRQDEIAKQADGVAKLLLEAQKKTTRETDEVARLAATGDVSRGPHLVVTLSYPNGNRQEVLLADVPRVGENVRLSNGAEDPALVVEHVLWVQSDRSTTEPCVIVSVRARAAKDRVGSSS